LTSLRLGEGKESSMTFEHEEALPLAVRDRFERAAEKAMNMLCIQDITISFSGPVGTSAEIGGKVYIEPTVIVLNLSDDGLVGLFLHELGHVCYKMLDDETKQRILSYAPGEIVGQWAVKILEDVFVNDMLFERGLGRFVTATDIDSLEILKPISITEFEATEAKTKFFVTLSLAGLCLDGRRYGSSELVDLVKQVLKWFPRYVKEIVMKTCQTLNSIPLHEKAFNMKEDVVEIGRDLSFFWAEFFFSKYTSP